MEPAKAHLLPQHTFPEQRSCSHCGRHRSLRVRRTPEDRTLYGQICSRRSCAEAKTLLRKTSVPSGRANILVVEVHHYYYAPRPDDETRSHVRVAELQADSAPDGRAELSGSDSLSRTAFRGRAELPPVTEEPPYVDACTKPSEAAVRAAISRRRW
jgi:hypothetical protein